MTTVLNETASGRAYRWGYLYRENNPADYAPSEQEFLEIGMDHDLIISFFRGWWDAAIGRSFKTTSTAQ